MIVVNEKKDIEVEEIETVAALTDQKQGPHEKIREIACGPLSPEDEDREQGQQQSAVKDQIRLYSIRDRVKAKSVRPAIAAAVIATNFALGDRQR